MVCRLAGTILRRASAWQALAPPTGKCVWAGFYIQTSQCAPKRFGDYRHAAPTELGAFLYCGFLYTWRSYGACTQSDMTNQCLKRASKVCSTQSLSALSDFISPVA